MAGEAEHVGHIGTRRELGFLQHETNQYTKIIKHPSDVVEIRMNKKSFKYKPGQYLFLNCPHLSFYEWHPFTISSAPHEEFVSCHIRVRAVSLSE